MMYLIQCVNAYMAIRALEECECEYQTAHSLIALKHRLQPHVDFFIKNEMKLVEEYARREEDGKITITENGGFAFLDPAMANEYAKRRTELSMVLVEEEIPVLHAPAPKTIRPVHLEALSGFLDFGGEGA